MSKTVGPVSINVDLECKQCAPNLLKVSGFRSFTPAQIPSPNSASWRRAIGNRFCSQGSPQVSGHQSLDDRLCHAFEPPSLNNPSTQGDSCAFSQGARQRDHGGIGAPFDADQAPGNRGGQTSPSSRRSCAQIFRCRQTNRRPPTASPPAPPRRAQTRIVRPRGPCLAAPVRRQRANTSGPVCADDGPNCARISDQRSGGRHATIFGACAMMSCHDPSLPQPCCRAWRVHGAP